MGNKQYNNYLRVLNDVSTIWDNEGAKKSKSETSKKKHNDNEIKLLNYNKTKFTEYLIGEYIAL